MKTHMSATFGCVILAVLSVSGCISRSAVVKNTFLLEAQRSGQAKKGESEVILAVQPFSITPAFQRNGIVVRISENEYAADYYNEYFVPPAVMVTGLTRQWLAESGLFNQVLSPNSTVLPTHLLDGHVRKMFLDRTNTKQPKAVLEIAFFLVKKQKRDETIMFHQTYTVTSGMESEEPRTYAIAQNAALTMILQSLEKDLAENL